MPVAVIAGDLPLLMVRGLSFGPIEVQVLDATSTPIDLTNYTIRAIARPEIPSPNQYDLAPTITTPAQGKFTFVFTPDQTQSLFPVGIYDYDVALKSLAGVILAPSPIAGKLTVVDQPARN